MTNSTYKAGDQVLVNGEEAEVVERKGGWTTVLTQDGVIKKARNGQVEPMEQESAEEAEEQAEEQEHYQYSDVVAQDDEEAPEDDEEDTESRGSVVRERYRQEYAARGNPNHCGDWLAATLDGAFLHYGEGQKRPSFDVDAFEQALAANGVELSGKWANLPYSNSLGWQGRYRMNGRQKLEKVLAKNQATVLHLGNGVTVDIPADIQAELADKHG